MSGTSWNVFQATFPAATSKKFDHKAAAGMLRAIASDPNAVFDFRVIPESVEAKARPGACAKNYRGTFAELSDVLKSKNRAGFGVYFMLNESDGAGSKKKNVVAVRCIPLDLDGSPLPARWELEPHLINETSPGRYQVFFLIEPTTDLAAATEITRRMAAHYRGDPSVSDATRVMRLAGFYHQKGKLFRVRPVLENEFEPAYGLSDFAFLTAVEDRTPSPSTSGAVGDLDEDKAALLFPELDVMKFGEEEAWRKLAMALHAASAGNPAVRDLLLDWSEGDPNPEYNRKTNEGRWNSFRLDKASLIGVGTLIKICRENGLREGTLRAVFKKTAAEDFEDAGDLDVDAPENGDTAALAEWQWIADSMQYIHNDGLQRWNDRQFQMLMGYLAPKGNVVTEIQRGKIAIRKFTRQVYIPKAEPIMQHEGETVFNIWRPSAMLPKPGDHQWFLDHVAHLFPDETSQQHLLDFMAQLVKNPEVKINFALLIQSAQGIGKGALAMILRRIIGKRNCVEPSNDEVTKAWTGWQEGAQLAIINELMASGRADVLNRLKSPITEDTLRIEKKFGNSFGIPNHMNLFCMTNHKDALPIDDDDRRWLILFSASKKCSPEYYAALFRNIADADKVAAVMHYLLHHGIKFNAKAPAPFTAAKREMGERAKSDVEAELQQRYDEGRGPFDFPLVRVAGVIRAIKEDRPTERNMHAAALKFLDHIGARKLRRYKKGKDGLPAYQLYAIRDHDRWDNRNRADVIRAFAERYEEEDPDFG